MRFPELSVPQTVREMLTVFRGYHAGTEITEGEFADMENLTSDCFPLLSSRPPRGLCSAAGNITGLIAKDRVCHVSGSKFYVNDYPVEMGLSQRAEDCPKRLVSMGAYVVILPDKKYINTMDLTDRGNLEAEFQWSSTVDYLPCTAEGEPLTPRYIQPEEPSSPENMALWLDTSRQPPVLLQWSAGSGMWVDVENTFVRLEAPGIGAAFREGDGVRITGSPEGVASRTIIAAKGDNFLAVSGLVAGPGQLNGITVRRKLPAMDFVIECGNRLWGCRYGLNNEGEVVNEIYASKLGDFRNWDCYAGTAMDSYTVSLGEDGPFTGAAAHMGYPVFFRENCLHKLYGSYPANFRLQTTACQGVQRGSGNSLAIVGETLFYKSPFGICAYDGSLPVEISRPLGRQVYRDAAAGSHAGKYYISMADAGGEYHLFVYDRARNLWHREDGACARCFCSCRGELYFLDADGRLWAELGTEGEPETVHWMAQTGDLGLTSPDNKYISRLTLRLWLGEGAGMRVSVRYDEEPGWRTLAEIHAKALGSVTLPMSVRRCDHLRLKLEGTGPMRLYALTKTVEQGSDVF